MPCKTLSAGLEALCTVRRGLSEAMRPCALRTVHKHGEAQSTASNTPAQQLRPLEKATQCAPVPLYPCTRTPAPCTPVPLHPCTPVPLYPVPLYPCTLHPVPPCTLYPCTPAPLYPCTPVPLYPCTPAPLYPCTPVPCTPVHLHPAPCTPVPLYPRTLYPCTPAYPCTRGPKERYVAKAFWGIPVPRPVGRPHV